MITLRNKTLQMLCYRKRINDRLLKQKEFPLMAVYLLMNFFISPAFYTFIVTLNVREARFGIRLAAGNPVLNYSSIPDQLFNE